MNDVIFNNDKSAYDDWNIVLTGANVPLPVPKTATVDIKGADGVLDLSEVLTGDVTYNNRVITLNFDMLNDSDYYTLISNIANYLHGRNVTVRFTNDDDFYYIGRASINQWECVKRIGKIVIHVDCDPYKYKLNETVVTVNLNNETKGVTLHNLRKRVSPTLDVTGNVTMTFKGVEYPLIAGKQQILNFVLTEDKNLVSFKGTGVVKITYRQGAL